MLISKFAREGRLAFFILGWKVARATRHLHTGLLLRPQKPLPILSPLSEQPVAHEVHQYQEQKHRGEYDNLEREQNFPDAHILFVDNLFLHLCIELNIICLLSRSEKLLTFILIPHGFYKRGYHYEQPDPQQEQYCQQ